MSWLKRHTVTAAVISLLLAGALWLSYPGVPAQWVFLGLGAAALLAALSLLGISLLHLEPALH